MRRLLPRLAYDRPVTVFMAFIAAMVVGLISWQRIPLQMMPDGFEPSFLWVWVSYPDGSPRETDEAIVKPVLAQLGTVPGIKHTESHAYSDYATFGIEFHQSTDMDEGYNSVVDRLERSMVDLPDDVERFGIWRYNPDDEPVMWAGVSFPDTVSDPYYLATQVVQPRIERIPGVAAMDVWGVYQRSLEIHYDREQLYSHGVDLGEVQRRLMADNFQSPAGRITDRGLIRHVRSLARFDSPEDIIRYPVKDGVALEDIADIGYIARRSLDINRVNGDDGAVMAIRKESSANTVEAAANVKQALADLSKDPRIQGAEFFVFFSQGDLITDSIQTLVNTGLAGGFFSIIVLYLFLREWRMTLLIAASIPFSLIITVAVLYFRGDSLNPIALMGLMLAVGMVVDNAIVVIETIYRRRADGAGVREAAIAGTAEVNLAIFLSTMTTVVVFLPIILMTNDATFSFFMGVLGLPVVFALVASLFVALLFAPVATRLIGNAEVKPDAAWLTWLIERYAGSLGWMLRHRWDAGAMVVAMFILTIALPVQQVDCTGDADSNINNFTIRFTVPKQATPSERNAIMNSFEAVVVDHRDEWGVRTFRSRLQGDSTRGRVYVYLDDSGVMPREDVMAEARKLLPDDIAGVTSRIGWEGGMGGPQNQIGLSVHGEDMETLDALGAEVVRRVEGMPGVMSASMDYLNDGADELRLVVDREAALRYGLSAATVGRTLAFAMRSNRLNPYWDGDREVRVISLFSLEDRSTLDDLLDFGLWSPKLQTIVPVRAVTAVEVARGPGAIHREDRRAGIGITVDLDKEVDGGAGYGLVEAALADMDLPRGYTWTKGDQWDEREADDAAMLWALLLSVVFVFLLMGVLFESFLLPMCIITSIPMAMMGAFWGLYISGTPMDLMAGIGMVILTGVIVNNGIVLIDLVTQLRAEGVPRNEALIQAGRRRLRPILMTALTTIMGLVPMALGDSGVIGIPSAPLGRTVMSGLIVGTLLTLMFVPYLYALLDDLRDAAGGWAHWIVRSRSTSGPKSDSAAGGVATVVSVVLAVMLMGATPAHAERPVTYNEAIGSAIAHNPTIAAQRFSVEAARGGLLSSRGMFDVSFTSDATWVRGRDKSFFQGLPYDSRSTFWNLGAGLQGTTATGTSYNAELGMNRNNATYLTQFVQDVETESLQDAYRAKLNFSVTQSLLEGHRLSYNLRNVTSAREGLAVAELTLEKTKQELMAQTAQAYWTWVYQVELEKTATDSVGVAKEALRIGELRRDRGDLAPVEVTRLEAALVQARSNHLDASLAARKAGDAVLLIMGDNPGQGVIPATKPGEVATVELDVAQQIDVALAQNLDLAIARANLLSSQRGHRDSKHALLPSLSATLASGVGAQSSLLVDNTDGSVLSEASAGDALGGLFSEDSFPDVTASATLSVPLGNRAARGDVNRTAADVSSKQVSLAELERRVRADVSAQVAQLDTAQQRVALADANVRLARETLAAEEALAEIGRAIQKDVLEARAEVDRTRAEAVKARTDYRQALTELQKLLGALQAP